MTDYSVDEKLGRIEAVIQGLRPSHNAYVTQAVGLLRDYAERIEADKGAVPAATSCADHAKGETGYCTFHTQVSWGTKLFTHPPAQAAQNDWRIGFFERWRKAAHEKGYAGVAEAIMAAPPDFLRVTAPAPAPSIDLAAVREVIVWLRSGSIAADKLEAAIRGEPS